MSLFKGFTRRHLESGFGVRFTDESVVVPYYGTDGELQREKEFTLAGKPRRWLGDNKPQTPYGCESLQLQLPIDPALSLTHGPTAFVTEGESCTWALRTAFPQNPVIGLPGASSWQPEWRALVEDFPVVYLSFDGDPAGRNLLDAVWPDLPWARRVKLPDGLDSRDLLQLHGGVDEYERLLDDADYFAGCTRYILQTPTRLGAVNVAA